MNWNAIERQSIYRTHPKRRTRTRHRAKLTKAKSKPQRVMASGFKASLKNPYIRGYRQYLIQHQTPAEKILAKALFHAKLYQKFRLQQILFGYIIDFYCPSRLLAIELDGNSHQGREEYDESRTRHLTKHSISVVRFKNEEIFSDMPSVIAKIKTLLKAKRRIKLQPQREKIYLASEYSQNQLAALVPSL